MSEEKKKSSGWKVFFVVVAFIAAALMLQVYIARDVASTASHTYGKVIGLNGTPVK